MKARRILLVGVLLVAAAPLSAQRRQPRFIHGRSVITIGPGPQRLAVDATLLASAAPFQVVMRNNEPVAVGGLADLRLFDRSDRVVPYLLVYPPDRQPSWTGAVLLQVPATKKNSGFEADLGSVETVDRIRLDGLAAPFMKRVLLEGSGDRVHWTTLAAEATVFDLPEQRLQNTEIAFQRGAYRYLRVTWDDSSSARVPLPRRVTLRRAPGEPPPPPPAARLEVERRASEPGRSRYRVRLPGAKLPVTALQLSVGAGNVHRSATVLESRISGNEAIPVPLGRAELVRIVGQDATAEALRIPIDQPTEADLDLVIEDGDNPPLELVDVSAVFAQLPWIYFEAPEGRIVGWYGDPSATPPQYDLEAARSSIRITDVAEARWDTALILRTAERPAEPLPSAAGAPIDAAAFRFVRELPGEPTGLVALTLDVAVLAHSRGPAGRFSDLRLIASTGRQIPYLLERRDEPLAIDLSAVPARDDRSQGSPGRGANRTVYTVALPEPRLPSATVVLETNARVFQRTVEIGVTRAADRTHRDAWLAQLASATWRHTQDTGAAASLSLPVGNIDAESLTIVIDEGDNAPLPITAVRLLLPAYRVRFFRPGGAVRLAYGRDDLHAPQYDLALLAPEVMGAATADITAAAEPGAPRSLEPTLLSRRVFWVFIGVAALGLVAIIVRLLRAA
jgi:uncharacterized protein DUF3999